MNRQNSAADYLSLVSGYLYRRLRYEARELGVRWTALMVLNDLELLGPTSQRSLALIEQMTEPTMTVLIRQLHKSGWVKRQVSSRDARVKLISITVKGRKELLAAGSFLRGKLDVELVSLTSKELKNIESALEPLVRKIMAEIACAKQPDSSGWRE